MDRELFLRNISNVNIEGIYFLKIQVTFNIPVYLSLIVIRVYVEYNITPLRSFIILEYLQKVFYCSGLSFAF